MVDIAAVAEHVASLTAAASAFQLSPDVPAEASPAGAPPSLVSLRNEDSPAEAAGVLEEIQTWAREALDVDHVPAIWRALAHQPRLLQATWQKDRLVLGASVLDEVVKGCAALAVAQFRQSSYWVSYLTRYLRTLGVSDRGVVEIAGAVMHYLSFNTIAHGMRLKSPMAELTAADVVPGARWEHFVPPGARQP